MINVTRALIIDEPWISYLLAGEKNWEMRSFKAKFRGWIGLIKKRSGTVVGVANLMEVKNALSSHEMIATFSNHRISESMITSGEVAKWTIPWVLSDVSTLKRPVAYRHKSGAVTWVILEPEVTDAIEHEYNGIL